MTDNFGFMSVAERIKTRKAERQQIVSDAMTFGIPYLDKSLRGILKSDLILIGAETGVGKTEIGTHIALHNVMAGKKVYFFALEASGSEIEDRLTYKILTNLYLLDDSIPEPTKVETNFRDWFYGDYNEIFSKYQERAVELISGMNNFHTYYRSGEFGIKEFQKIVMAVKEDADLIIADHIHFFDMETNNENRELGEIVKKIRDVALISNVPVILAGHLRQINKSVKTLIPDKEDFHGSSNLAKIITVGIILAPGGMIGPDRAVTYFRVVKNRLFGAVTRYAGKGVYDLKANAYEPGYKIGKLSKDGKEFIELGRHELPNWLSQEE